MSYSNSFLREDFNLVKNTKKSILVLCESENGNIFGGFMKIPWLSIHSENILFSLTKKSVHKYSLEKHEYKSSLFSDEDSIDEYSDEMNLNCTKYELNKDYIFVGENIDPIIKFGNLDLVIGDDCGNQMTCFSHLGESFNRNHSKESSSHLADQKNFKLKNCVVFTIN